MSRKKHNFSPAICLEFVLLTIVYYFTHLPCADCAPFEAIFLNASPATVKRLYSPYKAISDKEYFALHFPHKEYVQINNAPIITDKVFQIEPTDAIIEKFSHPALDYHQVSSYPGSGMKVPLSSFSNKASLYPPHAQYPSPSTLQKSTFTTQFETSSSKPFRDRKYGYRYLDSPSKQGSILTEATVSSEYKISDSKFYQNDYQSDTHLIKDSPNLHEKVRNTNNFTDANHSFISVPSDSVISYEPTSDTADYKSISKDTSVVKQNSERSAESLDVPSLDSDQRKYNSSDTIWSTTMPVLKQFSSEQLTTPTVLFGTHSTVELTNLTNNDKIIEYTTESIAPSLYNEGNVSEILPSAGSNSSERMSSGIVAGIVIAVLVFVTVISSAVIYLLYRRFNGKCTSVVESKFNSDNCGYLDDSLRSSMYLNNHIELPKENSEEMTSLDNDSFLNSLETMTIQNYWADNSKNTKV